MSIDSVDQLEQARAGIYGDWHPPLMAFLWQQCERVVAGPAPMLLLQSGAFLLGLAAILRKFMSNRRAALLTVAILLFPPVLTTMAVVWKDSQMAGYLLAGTAALLSSRRHWRVAGCILLFVASAVRYNAMAATLPVIVLLFVWRDGLRWWQRYGLALLVWIAVTTAATATNRALTDHQEHAWHGSVAYLDIVGTLRYSSILPDDEVQVALAGVPLVTTHDFSRTARRIYDPTAHWWLSHDDRRMFDPPTTDAQRRAIAHSWWTLIKRHPVAFLFHRWQVFREILGASDADPVASAWTAYAESDALRAAIHLEASYSWPQTIWIRAMTSIQSSWLFRAYLYFLLALAMLPMCRRNRTLGAILLSGIVYELSFFAAGPSSDFRYSHYMICCTLIAIVIVVAKRISRRT